VDNQIKLLSQFPLNFGGLEAAWKYSVDLGLNIEAVFLVTNLEEFRISQKIVESLSIEYYSYFPFFNGKNLDFFKDNIFVTRKIIETNKPTIHDIYRNSTLNSFHFGKLNIFPDGLVKAGVNNSYLGILDKKTLADCILKEMQRGKSWFKTRKKVLPCKHCLFEMLCPSISNYNDSFERNNLCHLTPRH
jgi:pseudo-rSAM protein